ncbi:hypothetical protein CPB83DRAFT_869092 [Crepidotus variabilis]|uniref:Peroxisomal targeting signal 1 receptor n=1 Tax=Crepidotus variabilis TaxID=179855 RepID=A0A9P6JQX6_9AGAR|nr:hypothetical protein CPB83DRAFT_869092 [Crepidotus variabilis]
MALPMLAGGAECGPSNALQGLTKRLDQDRGIQQDFFGTGRAGSSREGFRTQQGNSAQDQDAARFFAGQTSSSTAPGLHFSADAARYDLSAMNTALSSPLVAHSPRALQQQQNHMAASSSWAADFMIQQPMQASSSQQSMLSKSVHMDMQVEGSQMHASPSLNQGMQWGASAPGLTNFRMNSLPSYIPQIPMQHHQQPVVNSKRISWDKAFQAQELHFDEPSTIIQGPQQEQQTQQRSVNEQDDLARTAGLLLDNLKHEQNPKFQQSQFMGLMKQLRDGEVIVDGDQIVENEGRTSEQAADLKGKGRALNPSGPLINGQQFQTPPFLSVGQTNQTATQKDISDTIVDANDAYFRQENEDYIRYFNETRAAQAAGVHATAETSSWDQLQADWDNFEATANGIKAATAYRFQPNNPYLLGDSSRTRNHLLHAEGLSALESVLELEAAVQRNVNDAGAWYDLGVKQQENEREHKALQALERAVELDPTHLPAWLALAISYTNDNNRQGTYDAIYEWVSRNAKYEQAVSRFRALNPDSADLTLADQYSQLIACLITMATSDVNGDVDADTQIALAVLLNTNEDYGKAQDCFAAALSVRPDDWLLYNRVGATMANSGRAEAALDYYSRALELNPGYIRARFNLGISFINLKRFEEAAQHILDALTLQDSDGLGDEVAYHEKRGVVSTILWDTLKTACLHMQRPDLAQICDTKDLQGFRERFM